MTLIAAAGPSRTERWLWRGGVLAGLAVVIAVMLTGPYRFLIGSVSGSPASASRPALCLPGREVPIIDSPHIAQSQAAHVHYNSLPPTSGPHFSFTTVPGVYDNPVPDGLTVHAMEHGHVVVHYAPDTTAEAVSELRKLTRLYPSDVLLTPNPALPHGIALTAWGRLDVLATYSAERIVAFVERLRGRFNHGWTRPHDCPQ